MKLNLPHLARIDKFRAAVKINEMTPNSFSELHVDLQRTAPDGSKPEPAVPDISIPFQPGLAEVTGFPQAGAAVIDNTQFQYHVDATYIVHNFNPGGIVVPAGSVVWQTFEIDLQPA